MSPEPEKVASRSSWLFEKSDQYQQKFIQKELPKTVVVLTEILQHGDQGPAGKVYLLGTVHDSSRSRIDVRQVLRETHPDIAMIEFCHVRYVRPNTIEEQQYLAKVYNSKIRQLIHFTRQYGLKFGLIFTFRIKPHHCDVYPYFSDRGSKTSEFLIAIDECEKACVPTHSGDVPLNITVQRSRYTWCSLWRFRLSRRERKRMYLAAKNAGIDPEGFVYRRRYFWQQKPASHEEPDPSIALKQAEILHSLYPGYYRVAIDERDQYMVAELRKLFRECRQKNPQKAPVVVGVVGMGHLKGMQAHWNNFSINQEALLRIPPWYRRRLLSNAWCLAKPVILVSVMGWLACKTWSWRQERKNLASALRA